MTPRRCVDNSNQIIQDRYCEADERDWDYGSSGYVYHHHWYYGGEPGFLRMGRPVFGGSYIRPNIGDFYQPQIGDDIGWDAAKKRSVDLNGLAITNVFALYPWESLLREQISNIAESEGRMTGMEPAWKMLWSNKALLAILGELFPNHPNLLETYLDGPRSLRSYVK